MSLGIRSLWGFILLFIRGFPRKFIRASNGFAMQYFEVSTCGKPVAHILEMMIGDQTDRTNCIRFQPIIFY